MLLCILNACKIPYHLLENLKVQLSPLFNIQASTAKPQQLFSQATSHHPDGGGAQMIAVAATLSTQLMKKLQSLVPVSDPVSGEVVGVYL